ncbi:MAG: oligosaccharide flippase family protein [Chloroflexi bacterium]|nr:oligosaccharide flippase family protein [Chloroflexota bacterium]
MSLAKRSVTSATWNIAANLTRVIVLFVRSILLARLLPIDVFGVYAIARSVVGGSVIVTNFGMGGAFLHRAPETEDEEQAAAVHLTLKSILTVAWATLLIVWACVLTSGQTRTALLWFTITTAVAQFAETPQVLLIRRVAHRRLALAQVVNALATTIVAVPLAWRGATLWALLSTNVVSCIVSIILMYVWRPVWRPRLAWSPQIVRYFLRFGSRNLMAAVLDRALDRFDDLWVGFYLGHMALGIYSRAYSFATYPRTILAAPINTVAGGTYAELKGDRQRLSRSFFRVNAFLVRSGFFLAGLLGLVAPEFIHLLLGEKWLPMLSVFRLMLVFTLLDPIKSTVARLFVAVGKPEQVVKARFIQLLVLLGGLYFLGPWLGITGVALAVDLMLVVGITILVWQAQTYIEFSIRRLFAVPVLALVLSMVAARASIAIPGIAGNFWRTGSVKGVVFCILYVVVILLLDRSQIPMLLSILKQLRSSNRTIT